MTRLAAAILLTVTTGVAMVTHHSPRRPAPVQSAVRVPAPPDLPRASRAWERQPLAGRQHFITGEGATPTHRRAPVRRLGPSRPMWATAHSARPAPGSGLSDVTMYCRTGNRNAAGRWPRLGDVAAIDRSIPFGTVVHIDGLGDYTVEDWIGSGSQYDVFGGDDAGCERRALDFGRQHRHVEVVR